jgi:hypothetical protein
MAELEIRTRLTHKWLAEEMILQWGEAEIDAFFLYMIEYAPEVGDIWKLKRSLERALKAIDSNMNLG